jgi:periplasmic protein TonB
VSIFPDNFDDILFKDRNKTYGAYILRKKYYKQLLLSILIIIPVFILVALILYLIINQPETILKESPYYSEYLSQPSANIIQPDEELLPELKKLQKKAAYTIPQVVTNEDEQALSDLNTDSEESDTTTNGTSNSGSSNGVLDGSGTDDDAIYTFVQEPPSFPGGDLARKSFIQRNIRYPKLAIQNKIQGRVYVSFIVEKNGSVSNVKVIQGIGAGCDDEAIRVVMMMPRWKPGKRQGHEVSVQQNMPINFILPARN